LIYFSIAFLLLPAVAGADLIVGSGLIGGSGDVENVLFNGSGVVLGPAYTLAGRTNQTSSLVNFTGMENLVATAGGQVRIGAADGFFDYLTIKMMDPNLGFSKIQFNVVPEPASMILFGTGSIVFARYLRKKFKTTND
jgi:hypothetical protein